MELTQKPSYNFRTRDITLTAALTSLDGFTLSHAEVIPPPRPDQFLLCEFVVICDDPGRAKDLIAEHTDSDEGLRVGSKRMDRAKRQLKEAMATARAKYHESQNIR